MNLLNRRIGPHPLGVWFAFFALMILMLAWAMQAYSLLDWDSAADLGLQNERFSGDAVERAWALESWGVAAADMLWPLPITIVALIGLAGKRFFGLAFAFMVLSIGVYFPLFFAFQRWATFPDTVLFALFFFIVPCLLGIVGLLACNHHFTEDSNPTNSA